MRVLPPTRWRRALPSSTYEDAKGHAAAIVAATRDRVMPPWKPESGYGQFMDERRLTAEQISTIEHWFNAGATEGDPAQLPTPPSWNNALFRQGSRAEAIDHLKRALALKPDYALAHDGLGVALYTEGRIDEAIEHYRRAIEIDPNNTDAQNHLATARRLLDSRG